MAEKNTQDGQGAQGNAQGFSEEAGTADRLAAITKRITSGEMRREKKEAERAERDREVEGKSLADKVLGGFLKFLRAVFISLPVAAVKTAGTIAAGVTRKTTDKLAGTNWEEEAKQGKLDTMGLSEMKDENVEDFQNGMKARQEAMSQLYMQREHLKEDVEAQKRAREMAELAGTNGPKDERSGGNPGDAADSAPNAFGGSLPGWTSDAPGEEGAGSSDAAKSNDGFCMGLLGEVSKEYHAETDGRYENKKDSLVKESQKGFKAADPNLVLRGIQKIMCAKDPMLGGREGERKRLTGPNAVIRVAANQVAAQETTIKLGEAAKESGNPAQFIRDMRDSLEKDGADSSFFSFVLQEANNTAANRDSIYQAMRDPRNSGRHTDLNWVKQAFAEYQEKMDSIAASMPGISEAGAAYSAGHQPSQALDQEKPIEQEKLPGAGVEDYENNHEADAPGSEGEAPAQPENNDARPDEKPEDRHDLTQQGGMPFSAPGD